MRVILNTYAYFWWPTDPDRLSPAALILSFEALFDRYGVSRVW